MTSSKPPSKPRRASSKVDPDRLLRALKRRAAYYRRMERGAHSHGVSAVTSVGYAAHVVAFDEAIAIVSRHLKPVPDRGVRRKQRV